MEERPLCELDSELTSLGAINPLLRGVSMSRVAMQTNNMGQIVTIRDPDAPRIMAGVERGYGDATFGIEFPDDCHIIKTIPRYGRTAGSASIPKNPTTAIIYKNHHTNEYGLLMLRDYNIAHQHFGFEYVKNTGEIAKLHPGARVPKGTRLASSPAIDEHGNYCIGLETNVMFSSDIAGTEDGVKARRGWVNRLAPTGYEKRSFEFGTRYIPTNIGDDPKYFKIFPEIGEKVHRSGLICCLRKYDPVSLVSNMTRESIMVPDYMFDRKRYIQQPDAEVVDIKIERNTRISPCPLPFGMDEQLLKYWNADQAWYKAILDTYIDILSASRGRGDQVQLEDELHSLVTKALAHVGEGYLRGKGSFTLQDLDTAKLNLSYRDQPMDAWRVEVTLKYFSHPEKGFKVTDLNGDKSIIVEIGEDEDMPIDENGNRVDLIVDPHSRWNRMTPASPVGQMISASGRDIGKRIQAAFGFGLNATVTADQAAAAVYDPVNAKIVDEQFDYVMGYYKIIAPLQWDDLQDPEYIDSVDGYKHQHLVSIIADHKMGLYLFMPPDNPIHIPTAMRAIRDNYMPFKTRVTFRGRDGNIKVSKRPMTIGSCRYVTLEKTAEDWMASNSGKLQVHGATAGLSNVDRYDSPGRKKLTRSNGESEGRLRAATTGGQFVAETADLHNNPLAHKAAQYAIYTAEKPTDIDNIANHAEVPLGGHRPLNYMTHIFNCAGHRFTTGEDV